MLITLTLLLPFLPLTTSHSWLHCTSHNQSAILPLMVSAAHETPFREVNPAMPQHAHLCAGWPRMKQNPGDWSDETSNYAWDLVKAAEERGDTHACHPTQRAWGQYEQKGNVSALKWHKNAAPMARAKAGAELKLMYGGNGHSRGGDLLEVKPGGDPGRVSVFWKGGKEKEIVDVGELTDDIKIADNGFAEDAFVWPEDPNVNMPPEMKDKGNWQTVKLPENMEPGRHMMVWLWSFAGKKRYTTCFDVTIE